jgi:hypothetical protein
MASYRIFCTTLANEHSHVLSVQANKWEKNPGDAKGKWGSVAHPFTKDEVVEMIESGDNDFWSSAPDGTKNVHVVVEKCKENGCQVKVIRSQNDDTTTNNLDYLPRCR